MEENPMGEGQNNNNEAQPVNNQPVNNQQPANGQPQVNVNVNNVQPTEKTAGICIAAMVLGIVAIALWCVWFISVPCAVLAFILGLVGVKKPGKGMAIAGIVTGAITTVTWIIVFVYIFLLAGMVASTVDDYGTITRDYFSNYMSSYYDYY